MARCNRVGLGAFLGKASASRSSGREMLKRSETAHARGRCLRIESLEARQLLATGIGFSKTDGIGYGAEDYSTQAYQGQYLSYEFTIDTSEMTGTATNVKITEKVPAGCTIDEESGLLTAWTYDEDTDSYVYTVGTVAPDEEITVYAAFPVKIEDSATVTQIVNTAILTSDEGDSVTATDTDTVGSVDLAITGLVPNMTAAIAGQTVTYTIAVTNLGTADAPEVVVADKLPTGTTHVAATAPDGFTIDAPSAGDWGTVIYSAASLAAGQSVTLTLVVQTNPNSANGASITDTADVTCAVTEVNSDDNVATSRATTVRMCGVGARTSSVDPTQTDLVIGGTASNDTITVTSTSSGRVSVIMNGANYGSYAITGRIVAYGRAGSDRISVNSACSSPAILFGGAGNDTLFAGSGNTVLVGGDGKDTLVAGAADNMLIGGSGADTLRGNLGNNILIGGSSAYDTREIALNALLNEWGRDLVYWKRVRHIYDGGAGIRPGGLNGKYYFNRSTLLDDHARDQLIGGSGSDFFFTHSSGGGVYDVTVGLKNDVEWLRTY